MQWKQKLRPQGRSWQQAAAMLISLVHVRPVVLLCKGCGGEHPCFDSSLCTHCACGVVTRYTPQALFFQWCSLTWMTMQERPDTNPFRGNWNSSARAVDLALRSPQLPLDTRTGLWRVRGAT